MAIDMILAGRKFGDLVAAYSIRDRNAVACRCCCGKLIHVAAADLAAGAVTSCGCRPASRQFHERRTELHTQQHRESVFHTALTRT